jgi:hypothetical protein
VEILVIVELLFNKNNNLGPLVPLITKDYQEALVKPNYQEMELMVKTKLEIL